MIFLSGRAVGSVISGQLVTNAGLTIPGMFSAMGITSCVGGISCFVFYLIVSWTLIDFLKLLILVGFTLLPFFNVTFIGWMVVGFFRF